MKKASAALLCAALLLAGCSSSTTPDSSKEDKDQNKTNTADTEKENTASEDKDGKALLQDLIDNASDDDKALAAWNSLFAQTAKEYNYQFEVEGDGEDYLFKENEQESLVEDNITYEAGTKSWFLADEETLYALSLTDIDDAYDNLEQGYGTLIYSASGDESETVQVDLMDTENDTLKGTIKAIQPGKGMPMAVQAEDLIANSLINYGYIRSVDPVHNASLYDFSLDEKDGKYVLTINVKDIDALKKASTTSTLLEDNKTGAPVLALDEITDEGFVITFSDKGVLSEAENSISHAASALDRSVYLNIRNRVEYKKAKMDDLNTEEYSAFMTKILKGELKEGDSFEEKDWEKD